MGIENAGSFRRVAMVVAGGVVLAGLVAGCTPLEDKTAEPDKTVEPETNPAASPSVVDVSVYPGTSADGFDGAIEDASLGHCAAVESGWLVDGTVSNSSDVDASYRVYVSLLDGATAETIGLIQVDVPTVLVGASAEWSGSFGGIAEGDHSCVLRVERTPAA